MEPVLERRHDAEVPPAAADPPEEVGPLLLADRDGRGIGRHEVDRDEVVAGQPVAPHQEADAAAERQARDARAAHGASGRRQAVGDGLGVEVGPRAAGIGSCGSRCDIDTRAPHEGEVDEKTPVARAMAGDVVTAAANGDRQAPLPCVRNGPQDVRRAAAAHDRRRMSVDRAVEHSSRQVVRVAARQQELASEPVSERVKAGRPGGRRTRGPPRQRRALYYMR